ncbi:MAG: tRNA (N6-threonylcarbamoyladenosine(37)-N6)-methyltransferase TrmO [Thermoplasmata archaeon]|nr:MAG: tRNA (N6-threonylcarbamoyladenosine(37)-N6)-methyltransferase TrmO [Thermoplasmata archaeon]
MQKYEIYPIGFVRKQDGEESLEILEDHCLGLYRLETISHAFILWWIHENDTQEARTARITIPRVVDAAIPPEQMGTFATRSPRRPNPVGLTLVKIIKVIENKVVIDHIDAYDGTPIIDIKPYLPNGDRVDDQITLPPWFQHLLNSRSPERRDLD